MRIKATKHYNDVKLDRGVSPGEEYEVTEARGAEIIKAGVAEEVTDPAPEDSAPETATPEDPAPGTPKKAARKKSAKK